MGNVLQQRHFKAFLICVAYWLILTVTPTHAQAKLQGQPLIDSFLAEAAKRKDDTTKAKLLVKVANNYVYTNPDESIKYATQALALATKLQFKWGMGQANTSLGRNYMSKASYPQALRHYTEALRLFEAINDSEGKATSTGNIGNIYYMQGDFARCLEYYLKALKMHTAIGDKEGMARITGNIAVVYLNQGDYPHSLEYNFKALKMRQEVGDSVGVASTIGNIGNVYVMQDDFPHALEYYLKAVKMHEALQNKGGMADVTGNIGVVYQNQNDYPRALQYFYKGLTLNEELGNKNGVAEAMGNVGNVYRLQHNYTQAFAWHFSALKALTEVGDKNSEAMTLACIGTDYLFLATDTAKAPPQYEVEPGQALKLPAGTIPGSRNGILRKAVEYLEKAIAMQKEQGDLENLSKNYEYLSQAAALLGDFRAAHAAHVQYTFYRDSVFSVESLVKIARLENQKRAESDSLKSAQERHMATLKYGQQRSYTYLGLAGSLALLVFSVFIFRERRKSDVARKRSDDLLLNILPAEVADELKKTGKSSAQNFENVTVLFTDFVDFTKAGEKMSPQELLDELHNCFTVFDEITSRYNLEKIKTIGDAYLAVAGMPVADEQHAANVVKAAIEIGNFMEQRYARLGNRTFRLRIGIHSGSVVAGIVGVKKFAYDIWGDAVNTAARMEQNCEPGKVNVSALTYELVKDEFNFTYRGEIDVKNKGRMKMYYAG